MFAARAGIDLTPEVREYTAEGMKFQQLTFHENKQRIEYEPPQTWIFDGGAAELHLKPPKKTFAEAVIAVTQLSKPQPLDENLRASLKEKFVASLPAGSQLVKVEQEIESPLLLNGNPTFEIIVSYQLMGEKFLRSALFANVRDAQLTFRFSARKDDFGQLHQEFRTSILSWHWIETAETSATTASAAASTTH
jgi:hypothetical protein